MRREPGHYDYLPYNKRPKLEWPGGARVAFWVAPNIEFYELNPPANPTRTAWPRPLPDVLAYSYRDYGNRAGFWRMVEAMDECGVRGSVSLNVAVCDHHPEIIAECVKRNWEFYSHGIYNTRYVFGMDEAQERAVIRDSRETIARHTGQRLDGWLAPALTYTDNTIELLAEEGLIYTCDLFHDDQPTPLNTRTGRMVSIPYSLDMNDTIAYYTNAITPRDYGAIIKAQFDQLYEEGANSGTVMCIPLHPYQVGQPHRMAAFADALRYITSHDKVWVATGREIARHFIDRHFDAFVDAAKPYRV
jgi:peptidoglycan/xylan/chitin deacetylase (PgdA/CDA1 family)